MCMIEFGFVYYVLIIQSLGVEIADRVYYALLSDCVYTARELNSTYRGSPPIRAYCIPETVKQQQEKSE